MWQPAKRIYCWLIAVLIIASSNTSVLSAQDTTNYLSTRGKDFWFTFLPNFHSRVTTGLDSLYVFIVAEDSTNGTLSYTNNNGIRVQRTFTLLPNQIFRTAVHWAGVELTGYNLNAVVMPDSVFDNETPVLKAFHVQTDRDVACYALNKADKSTDAATIFPTTVLDKEYVILSYKSDVLRGTNNYTPSQAAIVATEDGTIVTITPTTALQRSRTVISPEVVTLNKGEVYLLQSMHEVGIARDISGTTITSLKPVAVFSGHQRAAVTIDETNLNSRDHLFEQMLPTAIWGQNYITTPFVPSLNESSYGFSIARIIASSDSTIVYFNKRAVATLRKNQIHEMRLSAGYIETTKPVMVGVLRKSSTSGQSTQIADPFLMIIPPRKQFLTQYRFSNIQVTYDTALYVQQFITLIVPDFGLQSLRLDSSLVTAPFLPIEGTCYLYANISMQDGAHVVSSDLPFCLYVYGYGLADSYGYVGGMAFRKDAVEGIVASAGSDVCPGETTQLQVRYAARDIRWRADTTLSCLDCPRPIARPSQTTKYFVTAMDSLGCIATDSVVVKVYKPSILLQGEDNICLGDTARLSVVNTVSGVRWFSVSNITIDCDSCTMVSVVPKESTLFYFQANDSLGCKVFDSIFVRVNSAHIPRPQNYSTCLFDSVDISVPNGVASVHWKNVNSGLCDTCRTLRVAPSEPTYYTFRATDSLGCSTEDSVYVQIKKGDIAIEGDTITCRGGTIRLSLASKVQYIQWNSPTEQISCQSCNEIFTSPKNDALYTVTARDSSGCLGVDTVFIRVFDSDIVLSPNQTVCRGDKARVEVQSPVRSVLWQSTQALPCDTCRSISVVVNQDMPLYVRTVNEQGCISLDTITLTVRDGIVNTSPDMQICRGSRTPLSITTATLLQRWTSLDGSPIECDTCQTAFVKPQRTTRYVVDVIDSMGCKAHDTITVDVIDLPVNFTLGKPEWQSGYSVAPDSQYYIPVNGYSSQWTTFPITWVRATIYYDKTYLGYDNNLQKGNALPSDWSVIYDPIMSNQSRTATKEAMVFVAKGQTPISENGVLFSPLITTYFSGKQAEILSLDVLTGNDNYTCIPIDERGTIMIMNVCAGQLRRVTVGATNSMGLLSISPLPSAGNDTKIRYSLPFDSHITLQIFTMTGRIAVDAVSGFHQSGVYDFTIPKGTLPNGRYECVLIIGNERFTLPCLIQD